MYENISLTHHICVQFIFVIVKYTNIRYIVYIHMYTQYRYKFFQGKVYISYASCLRDKFKCVCVCELVSKQTHTQTNIYNTPYIFASFGRKIIWVRVQHATNVIYKLFKFKIYSYSFSFSISNIMFLSFKFKTNIFLNAHWCILINILFV